MTIRVWHETDIEKIREITKREFEKLRAVAPQRWDQDNMNQFLFDQICDLQRQVNILMNRVFELTNPET